MSAKLPSLPPGTRLGRLVLIRHVAPTRFEPPHVALAMFRCDCGKEKRIRIYSVTSGRTRSCGCAIRGLSIAPQPSKKELA